MTPSCILDTSALLAVLFRETGHEQVAPLLDGAAISAVNYLETITKQMKLGADRDTAVTVLGSLNLLVLPWDLILTEAAAGLSPYGWTHGLSLGDRVCLATARHLRLPAVTADRAWKNLPDLGVEVRLIR
jgi:ribonuclease VapC